MTADAKRDAIRLRVSSAVAPVPPATQNLAGHGALRQNRPCDTLVSPMSKLLAAPPIGGGEPPLFVRALRTGRPPLPWAWEVHRQGEPGARWRAFRGYGSTEDAWAAGRAALDRLPRSAIKTPAPAWGAATRPPGAEGASSSAPRS